MDWTVSVEDAGVRLDKFLAAAHRLGSRKRASIALDRAKVFVNDVEAAPNAGATKLANGDRVRVWMDRPGSSRSRAHRRSAYPLRGRVAHRPGQARRPAGRSARAESERRLRRRSAGDASSSAGQAEAARR